MVATLLAIEEANWDNEVKWKMVRVKEGHEKYEIHMKSDKQFNMGTGPLPVTEMEQVCKTDSGQTHLSLTYSSTSLQIFPIFWC